ncbi:MAG: rhodanese-like domain-containing protein [Candidatus Binataceae bacterium]
MSINLRTRIALTSAVAALAGILIAVPAFSFSLSQLLGEPNQQQNLDTFKLIHVAQLKSLMANRQGDLHIYDANMPEVRAKYGSIPGATLLASDDNYDIAKVLPPDRDAKLVFYCANSRCSASHESARRAVNAGYRDVSVMADGIMGWKAADQATVPVNARNASNS